MSPDGQETRYYFVATAYDIRGNESGYSNEVSEVIDFKAPEIPVTFTVTVIPARDSEAVGRWGQLSLRAAFSYSSGLTRPGIR